MFNVKLASVGERDVHLAVAGDVFDGVLLCAESVPENRPTYFYYDLLSYTIFFKIDRLIK